MKRKKYLSLIMMLTLCFSLLYHTVSVYAVGVANEKAFVLYSGGSFSGTNNQSGAMNMYVTTLRLLSEDAKVHVKFTKKSGKEDEFYWVANSELQENDGKRYSVSKSFLHTLYAGGDSISFEVISGSMSLQWPDEEDAMPYSYSKGTPGSSEESEESAQVQTSQEAQTIADQLGLDSFFKDGKFFMYTAKAADKFILEDDEVPAIGNFFEDISPGGFTVKDNGSAFAVSATYTEDGNIVWRFAFPADYSEEDEKNSLEKVLYDSVAWDEYKDKIDLMSQTVDDVNSLTEDVKEKKYVDYLPDVAVYVGGKKVLDNGKIPGVKKVEDADEILNKKIKVTDYFSGYFEITTDKEFNYISSSGKVVGSYDADNKHYIRQYFSPVGNITVPWFWSVNYDFDGCVQLGLNCSQDEDGNKVTERTGVAKAEGAMLGQAGAGIYGVVNVAGNLEGNVHARMVPDMYLAVDGKLYLSARFFNYYKQNLVGPYEYNHVFWDCKGENLVKSKAGTSLDNPISDNPELTMVSREFLDKATAWNGTEPDMDESVTQKEASHLRTSASGEDNILSVKGTGVTGSYLQKWTMEGSAPQIFRVGDKEIMTFLTMTEQGTASNAGRLMYSVKEGGVWSEPVAVWDNGKTDYYADAKVIDGTLYLTWQKASDSVTGEDEESQMEDAISKAEICVAQFDSEVASFTGQQYITENDHVDMLPQMVCNSSVPTIAWISNTQNSIDGVEEPNTICYSALENGTWSEEKTLAEAKGYIGNYVVYQQDADYSAVYSSIDLSEYEENAALTSTLYQMREENTTVLEEGKESIIGLQYCDGSLYWLSDNVLEQLDCGSDIIQALVSDEEAEAEKNVGTDFVVVTENGKKSAVWSVAVENGYAMYSALVGTDEISNRVPLFEREETGLQSFDVVLQPDGSYEFLMDELIDSEEEQYAMSEVIKKQTDEITMDMVDMTDLNRSTGNEQSVEVIVKNNGETTLDKIHIKVMSGETLYLDKVRSANLKPGERYLFSDSFEVTKIQQLKNFKVYVYGGEQTEEDARVYETVLGKTNFSLTMEKAEKAGKKVLKCKVTNESDTPSSGVVRLYDDINRTNQIDSIAFDKIAAGESDYLYFDIDPDQLVFDGENGLAYQAVLETAVSEYRCSDNDALVMMYASDFQSEDSSGESETGTDTETTGGNETGTGENTTGGNETGTGENTTGGNETGTSENTTGGSETGTSESTTRGDENTTGGNEITTPGITGENASVGSETQKDTSSSGQQTTEWNQKDDTFAKTDSVNERNNTETEAATEKRPKVSAVTKFKAGVEKQKVTLTWKKTRGISGYQLQVSTSKKFKKPKNYNISASKKKYVLKTLKENKKYYIRIRAYKTYKDESGKKQRQYGTYKTISIKTRRKG